VKLSDKELQMLMYLSNGYSYEETAKLMNVTIETVKHHGKRVRAKLDANNSIHAVSIALRADLI